MPHPPTAELNWWQAGLLAVVLLAMALGLSRVRAGWAQKTMPFLKEAGIVALLFALWQRAGQLSQHSTTTAFDRGIWINRAERWLHLPNERDLQLGLITHPTLGQWANLYYAVMHLSTTGAMLFWLFWRHRDKYSRVRAALAIFTGLALLVQTVAVAPPRLLPQLGFIDIAVKYGQSVYGSGAFSAQDLLAMPSVHIGWAIVVAGAVIYASTSRWRWLVLVHPLLTLYVITATGNHWWFDSLGSVLLLAPVVVGQIFYFRWRGSRRPARGERTEALTVVGTSS
ncbi:phosphatase PAP2 family protein [Nakamurella panacisegetis]|uniref:phosphatase PAP2 family protein n=1 Tax=Nakamurella panacisegetis TaxID=1090615 RepID=UPI0012FD114C|nr:phosphatase PAP2 family protein [Nakamurella panacisegetis]